MFVTPEALDKGAWKICPCRTCIVTSRQGNESASFQSRSRRAKTRTPLVWFAVDLLCTVFLWICCTMLLYYLFFIQQISNNPQQIETIPPLGYTNFFAVCTFLPQRQQINSEKCVFSQRLFVPSI